MKNQEKDWKAIFKFPSSNFRRIKNEMKVLTISKTVLHNLPSTKAATRGVLYKKVFLEISQNSQENTCARVPFLIKLQAPKFLRTPFLQNTSGRLQVPGGSVSKVEFQATGKQMLEVSKKLQNKGFFRRLNKIIKKENAIANDVVYHNRYCENARSKVHPPQEKDDSISHTL